MVIAKEKFRATAVATCMVLLALYVSTPSSSTTSTIADGVGDPFRSDELVGTTTTTTKTKATIRNPNKVDVKFIEDADATSVGEEQRRSLQTDETFDILWAVFTIWASETYEDVNDEITAFTNQLRQIFTDTVDFLWETGDAVLADYNDWVSDGLAPLNLTCSANTSEVIVVPSSRWVRLEVTANEGDLCALVYEDDVPNSKDGERILIPLGRSYDGHEWEAVGERFDVSFACEEDEEGRKFCSFKTPYVSPLTGEATSAPATTTTSSTDEEEEEEAEESGSDNLLVAASSSWPFLGEIVLASTTAVVSLVNSVRNVTFDSEFQLRSYDEETTRSVPLSNKDMAARFFEQATFGPTRELLAPYEDLADVNEVNDQLAEWTKDQFDSDVVSSHRTVLRHQISTRLRWTKHPGTTQHPCDPYTTWHTYTFRLKDSTLSDKIPDQYVGIFNTTDADGVSTGDSVTLFMYNVSRTEVPGVSALSIIIDEETGNTTELEEGYYKICSGMGESIGGTFELEMDDEECYPVVGGNPKISFDHSENPILPAEVLKPKIVTADDFEPVPGRGQADSFFLKNGLQGEDFCDSVYRDVYPLYLTFDEDTYYSFDPRLVLHENTIDDPQPDGGGYQKLQGARCNNVPRTYLNEDTCIMSDPDVVETCSSTLTDPDTPVDLNEETFGVFYDLVDRHVLIMADIAAGVDNNPCVFGSTSRWKRVSDSTVNDVDAQKIDDYTRLTLTTILNDTDTAVTVYSDHFDALRDATYGDSTLPCYKSSVVPAPDANHRTRILIELDDGETWELVHPDVGEVFDMTPWIDAHFGDDEFLTNVIEVDDTHLLHVPDSNAQTSWKENRYFFPHLGTYMTSTTFQDLPNSLQQDTIAEHFGVVGLPSDEDSPKVTMLCGSFNEIANDLSLGNTGFSMAIDDYDDISFWYHQAQRNDLWPGVVLFAPDQLRQRVAWALAQLFAISPDAVGEGEQTEGFMYYYDIFVRGAFGTYRDLLKEITYSPHMAEMLTYIGSRSAAYVWENYNRLVYADENYAREIMQLFTIGTDMLNPDGTPILDENGNEILTYTNAHVASFARAWTGFARQTTRGNVEIGGTNRIDPMYIVADWRDVFPKVDLYGGYIGDVTPLCVDLPERQFLMTGAKYRLLGSTTKMELHRNPASSVDLSSKMMTLKVGSDLYEKLCRPDGDDECQYPSVITLDEDLSCHDEECSVDSVRVVEVGDGMHFEYIRPPCVELSFLENAVTVRKGWGNQNAVCVDPLTDAAGDACCPEKTSNYANGKNCAFLGERMTQSTAVKRCRELGKHLCDFNSFSCDDVCCSNKAYYHWKSTKCSMQVKVEKETGNVAIVHRPGQSTGVDNSVKPSFREDNLNYFQVYWEGLDDSDIEVTTTLAYPNDLNNCGYGACVDLDDSCLCDLVVNDDQVFRTGSDISAAVIKKNLFIGSPNPASLGIGRTPVAKGDVRIHHRTNVFGQYDTDTIFEVEENSKSVFYKNLKSNVVILDSNGQETNFAFRNPPHFNSYAEAEARDAHHETEAVLDNYMRHPNVPPFLAKFFLMRFGVSNPAPRYVESVATAFKEGIFTYTKSSGETITYGSGEFSDMSAMVAAILFDRESRSATLDLDQSSGSLKEPLLKVVSLLRAMGYNPYPENAAFNTMFSGMTGKIDQMSHEIKTVFSFFWSDYTLPGAIENSWLVAPEAMRYLPPYVIGLVNGLFSIVKYGLTSCDQGFGVKGSGSCRNGQGNVGNLTYLPINPDDGSETVDELATILTAGRLSQESRDMILDEYDNAGRGDEAFKVASHLVVASPEFHSAGGVKEFSGKERVEPDMPEKSEKEYKAVLFLNFEGGMDSFNMLVPHSGCKDKDMYEEYATIRDNIALDKSTLLTIDAGGEPQVCDYFGIHSDLPALKTLYNNGDLLFICNQGVLFEDVNKYDWYWKTPYPIFGHDSGQREAQRVGPRMVVRETGAFGRMNDALTKYGHKTGSISVASSNSLLTGEPNGSPSPMYIDTSGVKKVFPNPPVDNMKELVADINNVTTITSGKFASAWSDKLAESIWQNELLHAVLENATLINEFPESGLGRQFEWVSKAINGKDGLGLDRCAFYLKMGGFDTHFDQEDYLGLRFEEINDAIETFVAEMKAQKMWENVVIVTASDFGRTITPNGGDGTDHGWGGNYFAVGGSLRGGRIIGEYPADLTRKSTHMIGRSRPIPTTSYDAVLNAVAQWYGVTDPDDLDRVLPNRNNFNRLYESADLFA